MNEAETRAEHIDPALRAAGWGVVEGSRIHREYEITKGRLEGGQARRAKALLADYVLVYRNTKLAVLEAKAWGGQITDGLAQAKNYADKLAIRFAYASNGQGIYGADMTAGTEGELAIPGPKNCGTSPLPRKTLGATTSPGCRLKIKGATFKAAIIRTLPLSGCWKRSPPIAHASC